MENSIHTSSINHKVQKANSKHIHLIKLCFERAKHIQTLFKMVKQKIQNILCADSLGSAILGVTGGSGSYTYSIDNINQADSIFPDLNPGDYTLLVFDSNDCFADTLITTDKGEVKIVDVNVGDKVLTSEGYKRVLRKFSNGKKLVKK